jgi:5-methylcytosine-specific restriction enzyme subunit McrC
MTEKTLSQILRDGSLVDNTVHVIREMPFPLAPNLDAIRIERTKGKNNNPQKIRGLMERAAMARTIDPETVFLNRDADYEHNTADGLITTRGNGTLIESATMTHSKTSELVFLTGNADYENIHDDASDAVSGESALNFTLTTGNLIGVVKFDRYTLKVSSRFGDDFLKYIIADADGFVELPDQGGTSQDGYKWLLIFLWLVKRRKAFRLGLPKAYTTRSEELTRPRGSIDPVDYVLNHTRAVYRCTFREHRYDIPATRLIAGTLRHLESHALLRDDHALNRTFQVAIQGQRGTFQEFLATPILRNPYFADYNPVIKLSKQILRNEMADFGDQSQTNAFLFDVSMLFEYFVRKSMKRAGVSFHDKNSRDWTIPSGLQDGLRPRHLIPDLIFDLGGATYVFDVKYKSFDFKRGVSRGDLFQLHTYIGQVSNKYNIGGCGFVYPIRGSRWQKYGLEKRQGIFSETITQGGRSVPFHVAFIKVPEAKSDGQDFRNQFKIQLKNFLSAFLKRLLADDIESDVGYLPTHSQ